MPSIAQLDPYQVQNITVLKLPNANVARELLQQVAKQVQPILRRRQWRVPQLSEFFPRSSNLLGLNVGGGGGATREIKIRLRCASDETSFLHYESLLGTMLHEITHNIFGPHDAKFYKLLDELTKECEELMAKGVSGSGAGFDARSMGRLGGRGPVPLHNPDPRKLRDVAVKAAEERRKRQAVMSSGPQKLGGGSWSHLTPAQAAAAAAERRAKDNLWCPSGPHGTQNIGYDDETAEVRVADGAAEQHTPSMAQAAGPLPSASRGVDAGCGCGHAATQTDGGRAAAETLQPPCSRAHAMAEPDAAGSGPPAAVIDLTEDDDYGTAGPLRDPTAAAAAEAAAAGGPVQAGPGAAAAPGWDCGACTLRNGVAAASCAACGAPGPQHAAVRREATTIVRGLGGATASSGAPSPSPCEHTGGGGGSSSSSSRHWTCRFCTLLNGSTASHCSACGEWRFSSGLPSVSRPTVAQKM